MVTNIADMDRQTVNLEAAGRMLGISRATMYERARRDELPVPVIRIGTRMVISKRALDAVLGAQKTKDGNDAIPA